MTTTTSETTTAGKGETSAASAVFRGAVALFLLGVAAVPFMQPFTIKVAGSATQVADLIFALAGLAWAVSVVLSRGDVRATAADALIRPLRRGRFYAFVAPYFAAMLITTLVAPTRSLTRIVIQLYLLGLSVLAYNLVRSREDTRRTLLVWTGTAGLSAAAILVSAVAFYLVGLKDPNVNPVLWTAGSLPVGNYPRVRAFFLNGNMTGNYLAISACLSFGLAAFEPKLRRVGLVVGSAAAVATLFTLSTALGGLAMAVGLFAWIVQRDTKRWPVLRVLLPLAIVAALALLFFTAAYPKRTEAGVVLEASPRWLTWVSSWQSFLKHPLFGNGLGVPLADVHYHAPRGVHEHLTDPHDAWLSIAGQLGAVGLVAFVVLLGWLGRGLSFLTSSDRTAPLRVALAGTLLVVVYQAFSCSLEDMRHVWLLFGLIAGVIDEQPSQQGAAIPPPSPTSTA